MAARKDLNLKTGEKISLVGNLATMLTSGIPILESVDSLLADTKGNQKVILEELKADLNQGRRVYTTFEKFPRVFNRVMINVIRAAEEAGTLEVALKDLRKNIQREAEFADKIKSALVYPVFIGVVFFGVLIMMLFLVIPKIAQVFGRLKVKLPLPTRVLIFLSNLLVKNGVLVLFVVVGVIALFIFLYKRNRNFIATVLSSAPIISRVVNLIDLTRFSRSMHLLLTSGMPITQALELTEDVVVKKDTARIIAKSREMVLAGKPLSSGFSHLKKSFPIIMIKLIEAGEKTGTLDQSMGEIAEHFDYEVTNSLKTLTALIEPIMLVLVGIVVGGMMLSIIAPIYGLISQVGSVR